VQRGVDWLALGKNWEYLAVGREGHTTKAERRRRYSPVYVRSPKSGQDNGSYRIANLHRNAVAAEKLMALRGSSRWYDSIAGGYYFNTCSASTSLIIPARSELPWYTVDKLHIL